MKPTLILAALLAATAFGAEAAPVKSLALSAVKAEPIPPGYNFPTPTATIDNWVATNDTAAMRNHAWDIWAGMTTGSGEIYEGANLPIWETWLGSDDVFPMPGAGAVGATAGRRALHTFEQPLQFRHFKSLLTMAVLLGPVDARVVSFNKFDPAAAAFIAMPQSGPGHAIYHYSSGDSLNQLNNAWPTGTSGQNRGTNDFTNPSIETKPVFGLVYATGLTTLHLWQGPAASTDPKNPVPASWTNCVLVDPAGKGGFRPATPAEIAKKRVFLGSPCKTFFYAPLSMLYSFKMTADEAKAFNSAQGTVQAKAGDYAALQAMHVNTKEITNWTWQTFYWQPGGDTPNGFPGSKTGQTAQLKAPWTNYAMCANYNQTTTSGGSTMDVCFNPYLETSPGIPAGITSNCMSCHGTARIANAQSNTNYPADYKKPIAFFTDPLYYNANTTHTDFSWAVASAPTSTSAAPAAVTAKPMAKPMAKPKTKPKH